MRIISTILFFLIVQTLLAQASTPDSLIRLLADAPNDSVRYRINKELSTFFYDRDRKKSIEFNEEALKIAGENRMELDVALCLELKGYFLNKENQFGEALKCYIEAFKIAENPSNEERSWQRPVDADPFQYRMQTLATMHHNLGHVLWSTGNDTEAIQQFRKSMVYVEKALPSSFVSANMNIGAVYLNLNMLDSALYYEKKALRSKYPTYWPTVYNYLGNIYLRMGKTDSAYYYYHKGINLARKRSKNSSMMICQMGLARWHLADRNKDSSLYYASEFLKGFKEFQGNPLKDVNISNAYELLYLAYQLRDENDNKLKFLQLAFAARDSINQERIHNLTKYQNLSFEEKLRLEELEDEKERTQNRIRTWALIIGLVFIGVVALILYRNSRQKQKANTVLQKAYSDLEATQDQLIHAEKMASLGELTAGIAHEIQNPLNFVNNFSEVNRELIADLIEELDKGALEEVRSISKDLSDNEEKIAHHGKRADAIVKGMLQHSRSSTGQKEPTDLNALADEYLRLAYHGLRAKDNTFNADYKTELDPNLPKVNVVPQDLGRVLLNLINNAFQACAERSRSAGAEQSGSANTEQGRSEQDYHPEVKVTTTQDPQHVILSVKDNGPGIPQDIKDKIFQPFFTTKPTGEGTGLGLSMSYDIVTKGHEGKLEVRSQEGQGTEFIVKLKK